MPQRRMVQCATAVNRDAVRRESIGGIEHVIVSSFTLPDDIVMNGGLYPAEEIEKGFPTLERTLAPVEHPVDSQGNFISASDPEAIHNFHAGAFNVNVSRENGRVHIEKFINVHEAMKTDRGRRLLDRINELETNANPRPIHTSVGVFVNVEETQSFQTNAEGDEFTWIARDMVFDHDAILLDSVGAAQPNRGVGIAVNRNGDEIEVDRVVLDNPELKHNKHSLSEMSQAVLDALMKGPFRVQRIEELFNDEVVFSTGDDLFIVPFVVDESTGAVTIVGIPQPVERNVTFTPKTNTEMGANMEQVENMNLTANGALSDRLNRLLDQRSGGDDDERSNLIDRMASAAGISRSTVTQILAGEIETPPEQRLRGFAEVFGVSLRSLMSLVDNSEEGDAMKDLMLKALADAGIAVNADISDADLMAKYNETQANRSEGDDGSTGDDQGIAEIVANAVDKALKPVADELVNLKANMNAQHDADIGKMAEMVGNSDKYPGIDADDAKAMPVDTLRKMAANCGTAHGIPLHVNDGNSAQSSVPTDMPE